MFSLAFPTSVLALDSSITIAKLNKTHTKHNQTLLTGYAETSSKAHMLHQFAKPSAIIANAYNLFVDIGDCWGVVPTPFLLNNIMLLLQSHLRSTIGDALRYRHKGHLLAKYNKAQIVFNKFNKHVGEKISQCVANQ
jgi:hypothetical protein